MDILQRFEHMPEDIIAHIGVFYDKKKMSLLYRIHKLYNKVEEIEKRTPNEWVHHVKYSKRYNVKITDIKHTKIQYVTMWGDKIYIPKDELINQGYVEHVRKLYRWYISRIITSSTPSPQYEGEKYINIVGEKMIAKMQEYVDDYGDSCLVFKKV